MGFFLYCRQKSHIEVILFDFSQFFVKLFKSLYFLTSLPFPSFEGILQPQWSQLDVNATTNGGHNWEWESWSP